jgi:hypothetical protein
MTEPADESQRRRALTELGSTLLVEAAAGTGKTSLLAEALLDVAAFEELAALLEPATGGALSFAELYARIAPTNDHLLGWNRHSPTPTSNGSARGEQAPANLLGIDSPLTVAFTMSVAQLRSSLHSAPSPMLCWPSSSAEQTRC